MTEPLFVDPSGLEAAGTKLQGLVFPVPPSQIVATGTDSISAAINETLPIIESPVVEGLPAVQGALTRTGSNIAAAAGIYANTDQMLGESLNASEFQQKLSENLSQVQPQVDTAVTQLGQIAPRLGKLGQTASAAGNLGSSVAQSVQEAASTVATGDVTPAQLVQTASMAGYLGSSVAQGVQGAAGSASTGATPAQATSDTTTGQSPADQSQLVDETNKDDEEEQQPDTVAEGDQKSKSVPLQPPTSGRSQTTPSEIVL